MRTRAKKDNFLLKIIDDLKTPANAQITALEIFLNQIGNKIELEDRELIELTLNSCNYMNNLLETFCAVNKLENEKLRLNYNKFYILDLIEETINDLKILLKYNELKIKINCQENLIINADKSKIKMVFENLLSNCINHSFKNTLIEINITTYKNKIKVEIKNNSDYIKPEILEEIFEKHKTHSRAYYTTGVSLGMYLSKEIIKAHFGQMIAKSSEENINTFGFEIPID